MDSRDQENETRKFFELWLDNPSIARREVLQKLMSENIDVGGATCFHVGIGQQKLFTLLQSVLADFEISPILAAIKSETIRENLAGWVCYGLLSSWASQKSGWLSNDYQVNRV